MIQHIKKNRAQYFLFLFLIILIAVMSALAPGKFLTVRNFKNMGFQMAEFGILAIGMSVVIMTGGINLSLPWGSFPCWSPWAPRPCLTAPP